MKVGLSHMKHVILVTRESGDCKVGHLEEL